MKTFVTFILPIFIIAAALPSVAGDCSQTANLSASDLLSWVETSRSSADAECFSLALIQLGELKNTAATATLVSLLDYRRPETEAEKLHISSLRDPYPAVPALFSIGPSVVPILIQKLQDGQLNETARLNAIRVLLLVSRENPQGAVKTLKEQMTKAKSADQLARLQAAASDAARLCPKSWHSRCEETASAQTR